VTDRTFKPQPEPDGDVILEVEDLKVHFDLDDGLLKAVDGISITVRRGRTLGLVGESGCGKSVTSEALLRIVPRPGRVSGKILLHRRDGGQVDLAKLDPTGREIKDIRDGEIAKIFQEPMKAFSPVHTIGNQIIKGILLHVTRDKNEARDIAAEMLTRADVPNAAERLSAYSHELSGGLRQRAMIAMALSCHPSLLIADEPTTALDVTVQAQVLQLIKDLQGQFDMAVIFITHDLGVIAEMADEVAVMYLGRIVERADVDTIFYQAHHPYTKALLASVVDVGREARSKLATIEGTVPIPLNLGKGCGFYSRCPIAKDGICNREDPPAVEVGEEHYVRCFKYVYPDEWGQP